MKATLFSKTGEKLSSLELPQLFGTKIREDMVLKYFEAEKFILAQPYSHGPESGKRHSASRNCRRPGTSRYCNSFGCLFISIGLALDQSANFGTWRSRYRF